MALWRAELGKQTESLAAGLALCAVLAYLCSLSRFLAARTAEMILDGIYRVATSPLEVALLTMLAVWLASWSIDRHTKAAQLFSGMQFRMLSTLLFQQQSTAEQHRAKTAGVSHAEKASSAAAVTPVASAQPARGGVDKTPAAAAPSSPDKGVASFRLPDYSERTSSSRSRARRSRSVQRATQPHPAAQHAGRRHAMAPRTKARASLECEAFAAPRRSRPQSVAAVAAAAAHRQRARRQLGASLVRQVESPLPQGSQPANAAAASPDTVPASRAAAARLQPATVATMQDAAAAGLPSNIMPDAGPPTAAAQLAAQRSPQDEAQGAAPSIVAEVSGAAGPAVLTSAWPLADEAGGSTSALSGGDATPPASPARLVPAAAPATPAAAPAQPESPDTAAVAAAIASAASTGIDPAEPPTSPTSPLSQWAVRSGAACAAWASSTVESLAVWRSPSAPLLPRMMAAAEVPQGAPSAADGEETTGDSDAAAHAAAVGNSADARQAVRCTSLPPERSPAIASGRFHGVCSSTDGAAPHHYTTGGIAAATPAREQLLQRLAAAARQHTGAGGAEGATTVDVAGVQVALGAGAANSVLASVGLDGDCPQDIRAHVTDEHLLQFAACVGEPEAAAAAAALGLQQPWADAGCLLGAAAAPESCSEDAWEKVIDRQEGGLCYEAYRQPLRKGLYMYRSKATFQGVSPADLRPFHLDDAARALWDDNLLQVRRANPASRPADDPPPADTEWCLHAYRSRFPRPMAPRDYQYARRVWHRPADGGAYVLCRGLELTFPDGADAGRAVPVTDFGSACVIRAAADGGGTEVVSLYFEDSQVRPGLAKMAVKGMWGYMQQYEAALREFAATRHTAAGQPGRQVSPSAGTGASVAAAGAGRGDPATRRACAALAGRLGRAARGAAHLAAASVPGGTNVGRRLSRSRWAGRLVMLAGIKVVHAILVSQS